MLRFPLVDNIIYMIEDDEYFEKQKKKYYMTQSETVEFFIRKNGMIDFSKSTLTSKPYAIQKIVFNTPTKLRVTASAYWGEDETTEQHVIIEGFDSVDSLSITKH